MRKPKGALLSCLIALAGMNACASEELNPDLLVGNWTCESGACWDEEIAFSIEDGVHAYNSWLHERPSASDGRWSLVDGHLLIECCAGLNYDYVVVRVTERELVLRDVDTEEETVLTRIGAEPR